MGQWNYIRYIIKDTNKKQRKLANYVNKAIKDKAYPEHIEYVKSNGKAIKKDKNYAINEGIQENRLFHHTAKKQNIDDTVNYNADVDKYFDDNKSKQYMLKQKKFMFDKEFSD